MIETPRNPEFAETVKESFERQGLMAHLNAELLSVSPGYVEIAAPIRPETGQQHGFAHAGFTFSIADSAAGYAALSLMPPGYEVLSSELKIHLLAPGRGVRLIARGDVLKPGRRLSVVRAEVFAEDDAGAETRIAFLIGTMIPVEI